MARKSLKNGTTKAYKFYIGETFGHLKLIRITREPNRTQRGTVAWGVCECKCGVTKSVRMCSLVRGLSESCGCMRQIWSAEKRTRTHCTRGHEFAKVGRKHGWCAECQKKYRVEQRDSGKIAEANLKYKERTGVTYQMAYRLRNPDRYRQLAREKILKQYGITIADYEKMLLEQNNRCAICKTDSPASPDLKTSFHVDHCHRTGVVRGLLCFRCNSAIGKLGDDPDLLETAAAYLRRNHDRADKAVA